MAPEIHPAAEKFYDALTTKFKEDGVGYIQGQDVCPICKGVINYTYHKMQGFLVYECSDNDCLPWPDGGAKKRRIAGLLKLEPTRYQKKS
jgi:hypothetical protein